MAKEKPLSPRRIASYCQVNFKTVLRWISEERLKAYQLPGGSNRVTKKDLINFLHEFGMPIPHELEANAGVRLQLITGQKEMRATLEGPLKKEGYSVKVSTDGFDAGYDFMTFKPNKVLLDMTLQKVDPHKAAALIKKHKQLNDFESVHLTCIAPSYTAEAKSMLITAGVDAFIETPFTADDLIALLAEQPSM